MLADGGFRLSMALVGAGLALAIQRTNTDLNQKAGRNPGVVRSCEHGPQFILSPGELIETPLTPDFFVVHGDRWTFPKDDPCELSGSESTCVSSLQ